MYEPRRILQKNGSSRESEARTPSEKGGVWRQLLLPDQAFSEKKFQDHRHFSAVLLGMMSLFLPSLWLWDYITDPVGAMQTIGLRLSYLLIVFLAIAFRSDRIRNEVLRLALPVILLVGEGIFVEILNRLDSGWTDGLGGFMYAMLLSVLGGQGVPLTGAISFTLIAALLPHGMAMMGLSPDFPHLRYAVLMWPAMGLTILIQLVLASEYAKRYQLEERLKALSNTDPLSGIANRRHFTEMLEHEMTRTRRFKQGLFVLMLDIDHFKRINDTYGHSVGDAVICHVAEMLGESIRSIDGIGRIGGEEFSIYLSGLDQASAQEVAERLRCRVESSPTDAAPEVSVSHTISIGMAELLAEDTSADALLIRADKALYVAKNGGRNQVVCAQDPAGQGAAI